MIKKRKRNGRFHKKYPVLLTGLLECECGYSYFNCYRKKQPVHKAYSSYHCSYKSSHKIDRCNNKGIEQTSLDDAVLDLLYKHFYEDITIITKNLMITARKRLIHWVRIFKRLRNRSLPMK